MKPRAIILLLILLFAIGITSVYGKPVSDLFKNQFPTVDVHVNGEKIVSTIPSFKVDGTTVAPVRALAQAMGGFVLYNDEDVNIVKPYVNIVVAKEIKVKDDGKYQLVNPFLAVKKGETGSFGVLAEVAEAPRAEELYFKLIITDANGEEKYSSPIRLFTDTTFLYLDQVKDFTFDGSSDHYKVKFLMKTPATDFVTVGENRIYVR